MTTLLLLVCAAHETYANLHSIIWLWKILSGLDITYARDVGLFNIMTGVGSHSSNHPCTYCISSLTSWVKLLSCEYFKLILSSLYCGRLCQAICPRC